MSYPPPGFRSSLEKAPSYIRLRTRRPCPIVNYQAVLSNPTNMNQGTGRIDYLLSAKDRLSGHYTGFDFNVINRNVMPFAGTQSFSKVKNLAVEHIHNFSATLLNTLRFGYSNTDTYTGPDTLLDHDVTKDFGLQNLSPEPSAYAPPGISIVGFNYIGAPQWIPNGAVDINRQIVDQVTWIKGRHSLKFGGDVRLLRYNDLGYAIQNGAYTFANQYSNNSVADFLLGIPQQAYAHRAGGTGFSFRTSNGEYSFFIHDDIRLARNLTLNAGLRYEYVQWPQEDNNELAVWNFQRGALDLAGKELPRRISPPIGTIGDRALESLTRRFRKTVIRTGAGITYGNFRQWEVSLFHFSPPFVYENLDSNDFPNPRFTDVHTMAACCSDQTNWIFARSQSTIRARKRCFRRPINGPSAFSRSCCQT